MLLRHVQSNSFGGTTWEIRLHTLLRIFVNETEQGAYVVEFKERKWIRDKVHFSFVSNGSLPEAIAESFDRVYEVFQSHPDFSWSQTQKRNKLNEVLQILDGK